MSDQLYVIASSAHTPVCFIRGVGIGCCNTRHNLWWTGYEPHAIRFYEHEALSTIDFIINVLDPTLEDFLYLEPIHFVPERF